ncbi:MAG TPA: hypothetical protein VMK12_32100, partial [Anaeromyxobacteraceae bacterium]|nr:hypothetical protein [Anaeromyxobacteraceae bacterium]
IEVGIEGLPAKRIYAWADILEVPRDGFFRFATGESRTVETGSTATGAVVPLTPAERELLEAFRKLPAKYQRRLRETAQEYRSLARKP